MEASHKNHRPHIKVGNDAEEEAVLRTWSRLRCWMPHVEGCEGTFAEEHLVVVVQRISLIIIFHHHLLPAAPEKQALSEKRRKFKYINI